jgi:hypothetical protein
MRSVWLHSVIAEVYSLSLALLIGMGWVAFAAPRWTLRDRLWGLALLGGLSVAHHRALILAAPALILPLLPPLMTARWQGLKWSLQALPWVFIGFLPYLYVILRAAAEAEWVYAQTDNWRDFWFYFRGGEADYLITRPNTLAAWSANLRGTWAILIREMGNIGLMLALGCTLLACTLSPHRRAARWITLGALCFFGFAVAYHRAVLPEAVLMLALPALVINVALTVDWLGQKNPRWGKAGLAGMILWALLLYPYQREFIRHLTTDPTGLASIEAARTVPRRSQDQPIFMLAWGPRYFAASFSRLVTGENADLPMVDHRADFGRLSAEGYTFYTEPDTFYMFPPAWWTQRLGPIYLSSGGPNLVRIGTTPRLVDLPPNQRQTEVIDGIWLVEARLDCTPETITLSLAWYAQQPPTRDWPVFVHLTPADSQAVLAFGDSAAPVHGWRPTSTWQAGEVIQDHYVLPRVPQGDWVRWGMFEQQGEQFINYGETTLFVSQWC